MLEIAVFGQQYPSCSTIHGVIETNNMVFKCKLKCVCLYLPITVTTDKSLSIVRVNYECYQKLDHPKSCYCLPMAV